ncbi:hypothetical protein PF005_g33468 [Phytophthora fragariae]|uniref:Uncharacterized protein n=1 Tax=Phytophthora fragariae TaxID=53985 RepID=A0A6A3UNE5_9STRA|nr:hypothetical protein PF003_g35100 [Phytophthora fragariae]KAE8921838.1 hypothetical protein PF009_g27889 [Phytophthora fragariae]KAE9055521.1 hypothetical protein PF007_g32292 [Phytophthora fragariae]KAE9103991.1 hypothetical protein PF006_g22028 [Phytophthora fragariae]KAE9138356.1 hypothetical protein PF010_g975 [Phytophthora fragariae]
MEDSGSRLLARQDFPHLSDAHWATLEKMVSLLGVAAFAGFPKLPAELQRERVERFDKYESSLIAHVSAAAQEAARATMRAEGSRNEGRWSWGSRNHEWSSRGSHLQRQEE